MSTESTAGVFLGRDPAEEMLHLISGALIAQSIYVAAELGIADRLVGGRKTADELAAEVDVHPRALYRILRALASIGIFEETPDSTFSLNERSELLRSDLDGSMRNLARFYGSRWHNLGSANIMHSVKTNRSALTEALGTDLFDYLASNPGEAEPFWQAMSEITDLHAGSISDAYDFSGIELLVDVGGAYGHLVTTILEHYPTMRGVVFELPETESGAVEHIRESALGDRCQFKSGNFFESVPEGADAYLLKWVIHDWDDEQSRQILVNCRKAMRPGGRILVIEFVVPGPGESAVVKLDDVEMLVQSDGRERTEQEFRTLFDSAGLKLQQIYPTSVGMSVLEAISDSLE